MIEYKTIKVQEDKITKTLSSGVADGWELVQTIPHQNGYGDRYFILILKRNA